MSSFISSEVPVVRGKSPHLLAFLQGTATSTSPLSKLRGQDHILRTIWSIVCEEWLDLHIDRFPSSALAELLFPWQEQPEQIRHYPPNRQESAGCPVAVIAKNLTFPDPAVIPMETFEHQDSSDLYINMMPFDLFKKHTLPEILHGYWPIIEQCNKLHSGQSRSGGTFGFLTIDERSVPVGTSQRRRGLHVESPGVMPLIQSDVDPSEAEYSIEASDGTFIPGAEHHWGGGFMMRHECVDGGIFMASNIADTTAVWNCRINDESGDIIGAHGNVERLRALLGPCTRTLEAGELIWMTDRTPHESLPIPASAGSKRRQYFRLVIGEVSAWFADHSTPNPLGDFLPRDVRIVRGDKFTLYASVASAVQPSWHCGTVKQIQAARDFRVLSEMLYEYGIGHLSARLFEYGVQCCDDLVRIHLQHKADNPGEFFRWTSSYSKNGYRLFNDGGKDFYDIPCMNRLITDLQKRQMLAEID